MQEKVVNLAIALRARDLLARRGVDVVMTRDGDFTPGNASPEGDLQARCDIANKAGADIFVSVHADSYSNPNARGATTYYYGGSAEGKRLADIVLNGLVRSTNQTAAVKVPQIIPGNMVVELDSRGTKMAHFWVLKYTAMPACLVEVGFLSNSTEEGLLESPAFQEKAAEGIARGICEYLGVAWKMWDSAGEIAKLQADGLINSDHQPDEAVAWGEFATVINRMRGKSSV